MSTETYPTIAAAERALVDEGFTRDVQRAAWVRGNQTAKIVRAPENKFAIERK